MEGAKLVGEIATDWEGSFTEAPVISDRLEAFTASIAEDNLDVDVDVEGDTGL